MHTLRNIFFAGTLAFGASLSPAQAQSVSEASIRGHISHLAGPALRGRGSATPDEAAAAAYVGAALRGYGLQPAPGMTGYTQPIDVVAVKLDGAPVVTVAGQPVEGALLFSGSGQSAGGKATLFAGSDPSQPPTFFRAGAWGNAYVVVADIVWVSLGGTVTSSR